MPSEFHGLVTGLSNEAYHGDHGSYSKSSLADFSKFPYNLIFQRENPRDRGPFELGTACHTAILELDKWADSVTVIPPNVLSKAGAKAGNAWKEWEAAQPPHKAIITEAQRDQVMRVYDSVYRNPYHSAAASYLTGGISEMSVFWDEVFHGQEREEDTGYWYMPSMQYGRPEGGHVLKMKVRPDKVPADYIVVDLKTTAVDVSDDEALMRNAHNLHYHWSSALTLRGMTMATGKSHRDYYFVYVQVGTGKALVPHAVRVVKATQEFIAMGQLEVLKAMERLAWCDKNDKWPWLPNQVGQMGLPGYVYRKLYQQRDAVAA